MKQDPDAIQSFNLPVLSRPKPVTASVLEWKPADALMDDGTVEAVGVLRRVPVVAIDFYRGRA